MCKGYDYEIFINEYLNSLDNIKISYLWKDIPVYVLFDYGFINSYNEHRLNRKTNNINKLEDIGTDIIYINNNDECVIVQCKNYTYNIKIDDLAGFWCIMSKHIDKNGEIYFTNKLTKKIYDIYGNDERIKFIKKEYIQNNIHNNDIKPYEYQQEVINLANEFYKNNDSGIISMPCGTGKTLISCYISMSYSVVIMITPLKEYANQNINRYKIYDSDRESILIDSDGTRNIDKINEFILKNQNKKILLSVTYKSCDIINKLKLPNDTFIIFDEFHNFTHNNIYNDEDNIYKLIYIDNYKKLYLSATPRIYELEDNDDIDVNDIFGDYIYNMSFNEAINNKYISDYELYLPIFESNNNDEIKKLNIHQDYLLKLQFLIEAIKICGTLKMIIYLRTHEDIYKFIEEFNKINEYYSYDVNIDYITSDINNKKRKQILEEFNNSTKISLLLSVYILDEAIDIPNCNAIYMSYISNSKIKNIQRLSRALRYKKDKIAKIFLFAKDIDESKEYISSIREYDTDFIKKINFCVVNDNIKSKKERKKINEEYIEKNKIKILGVKLYRSENWYETLSKVKKYINEHNKRPTSINKDKQIKRLGQWISHQITNYKNKKYNMQNEDIYNEWSNFINEYEEYFLDNTIIWYNNLELVKKYIDENYNRPSSTDKNKDIKILGKWIQHQITNYKNKEGIMKNEDIYNKWTNFIDEYEEYFKDNTTIWYNNLEKVKKYIDENYNRPSSTDKNKDIRILASWINTQNQNYKNKIKIMKNEDIYNEWSNFINEYEEYFLDNNTIWYNNLELVKKYIDENNKRPSSEDKNKDIKILASWVQRQIKNYINKKQIMQNEDIYNEWSNFIDKYEEYFFDNKTVWYNNLDLVKKYIEENNKKPSHCDKNKDIRILASWIYTQNQNYKNKIKIMQNEDIYNEWSNFINEYEEYFLDNNTVWYNKLELVKKYINENNKRPSSEDKNKDIKILGAWIRHQIKNYKSKNYIMKNEEIYNEWNNFINEYEEYF